MPKASEDKPTAATAAAAAADAAESDQAETKPKRSRRFSRQVADSRALAERYFKAVDARDVDGMVECWAAGGLERITPVGEFHAPEGVRSFFTGLFAAVPDARLEMLDVVAEDDKVVVRWRTTGTFCGASFQGVDPTGARLDLEGMDMLTIEDGLIHRNDAYYDGAQFARQIGLLPPQDSAAERGMTKAFNVRTRVTPRGVGALEKVADGVWLVRGGFPLKTMNVYLLEDDDGVTVFDAGIRAMTRGIAAAAGGMGGIKRIVLGHGHPDHRGAAPGLRASVYCHPDEVSATEGDGGAHHFDFSKLEHWHARALMPRLTGIWDGGPVAVTGTIDEGDDVAGFKVVHVPGHTPGMIALWRESDRVALTTDAFYTLDPQSGRYGPARLPHAAFTRDTEQARASLRKLADLEPAAAWPGHAEPVIGDVAGQLRQAADAR